MISINMSGYWVQTPCVRDTAVRENCCNLLNSCYGVTNCLDQWLNWVYSFSRCSTLVFFPPSYSNVINLYLYELPQRHFKINFMLICSKFLNDEITYLIQYNTFFILKKTSWKYKKKTLFSCYKNIKFIKWISKYKKNRRTSFIFVPNYMKNDKKY